MVDELPCWVDGVLGRPAELLRPHPAQAGPGCCYTTARVVGGWPRLLERHVRRLRRDAACLDLEAPDARLCRRALLELSRAAFAGTDGIVRLELRRDLAGRPQLRGIPRRLGPEPECWGAIVAGSRHPGPQPAAAAKLGGRPHVSRARHAAQERGVQEAILLDAGDRVVEGARTNLVVAGRGRIVTPPLDRGAVAGIAREIVLEGMSELRQADVLRDELFEADEIIALNAVRGARPVVRLDGRVVGAGRPGPVASRLARLLEQASSGTLPPAA